MAENILVVDDEREIADLVEVYLQKKNVRERYLFCCNGIEDGDMYPMEAVILVYRAVLRLVCQW